MGTGYSYSSLTKRRAFCVALAIIVACTALRLRSLWFAGGLGWLSWLLPARDDGGTALWRGPAEAYDAAAAAERLWGPAAPERRPPTVAACARCRNEGPYLREWIEFHKLAGVSYFYIFDDAATPCPRRRGVGDVCADRVHDAAHGERGFRDECLRTNPDGADWIAMIDVAMIDVDEFLYPGGGASLPAHLAAHCAPSVAYALVRWQVFGAAGWRRRPPRASVDAYRERSFSDDFGCYPRLTCGDDYAPPVCAKVLARARCVVRQGTHYVVETAKDGCETLYAPEGSGRGVGKLGAPRGDAFARSQHDACAAPLRINHYAVRSREEYVAKFERGRISSGARDARNGLAQVDAATGATSRAVDAAAVAAFLDADVVEFKTSKASKVSTAQDLMLAEFVRRDFSTARGGAGDPLRRARPRSGARVLDEAAVSKYGAGLRAALGLPAEPFAAAPSLRWACESNGTDGAAAEAAVWRHAKAMGAYAGARDGAPAVFVHVPKTAGTSLNLVLAKAAKQQKRSFCEVTFRDLDDAARRAALARSCGVFSAETDVSARPPRGTRIFHPTSMCASSNGPDASALLRDLDESNVQTSAKTTSICSRISTFGRDVPNRRSTSAQVLPFLGVRRAKAFTFLRDPLRRVASQYEHHLAGGRVASDAAKRVDVLRRAAKESEIPNFKGSDLGRFPLLERDARCRSLRHPAKCQGGGWCGIFQNHMTHVVAGAQHLSDAARGAERRSSDNLRCAAARALEALPAVGLTERLDDSLCVVFAEIGFDAVVADCCGSPARCALFGQRATRHSAADRGAGANATAYLADYLDDDVVLAALYEGNALDCDLYDAAARLLGARLRAADFCVDPAPVRGSATCARARAALAAFQRARHGA
ncbi:hypothetical protein JL721_196 [Aureococcus anophagefferens]|nr:hypothetical protein JL721_196 [Aureococcus anophagefferens]